MSNSFPSVSHIDLFIRKKETITPKLDPSSVNQCLDKFSVIAFKNNFDIKDFPVTFDNYSNEISLPVYYNLTSDQVQTVAKAVIESVNIVMSK